MLLQFWLFFPRSEVIHILSVLLGLSVVSEESPIVVKIVTIKKVLGMGLKLWIRQHDVKNAHDQEIRFAGTPT